jgi:hypothetical protein
MAGDYCRDRLAALFTTPAPRWLTARLGDGRRRLPRPLAVLFTATAGGPAIGWWPTTAVSV